MINILICMVTNFFRIYLIYRFLQHFFERVKVNKSKELVFYFGFYVINTILYLKYSLVIVNIVNNLLGILLLVRLYTKQVKTMLFVTGAIYLANMASDIVTVMIFVDYQSGKVFDQIYEIITVLLLFISELIIEKIVDTKRGVEIEINNSSLIFIPLCSIGVLVYLTYSNSVMNNECIVVAMTLIFINFFVFYLYNLVCNSFNERLENSILKQKVGEYSNQLNLYLETEKRVKALKHDMKHHMSELRIMATRNNTMGIQKYIDEMECFLHNPNEIVNTGNIEIDSLLNFLLQKANNDLNEVKTNIVLRDSIENCFDINVVLGNLLENAIEAALNSEDKRIDVLVELKQGVLRIKIQNSYSHSIVKKDTVFLTTKKKKDMHGIGLNNVQRIVEKYNGIFENSYDERNFCVSAILYTTKL